MFSYIILIANVCKFSLSRRNQNIKFRVNSLLWNTDVKRERRVKSLENEMISWWQNYMSFTFLLKKLISDSTLLNVTLVVLSKYLVFISIQSKWDSFRGNTNYQISRHGVMVSFVITYNFVLTNVQSHFSIQIHPNIYMSS